MLWDWRWFEYKSKRLENAQMLLDLIFAIKVFKNLLWYFEHFLKSRNNSLGFAKSCASWKMTYLSIEPAKPVPEAYAPTTPEMEVGSGFSGRVGFGPGSGLTFIREIGLNRGHTN